MYLPILKIEGDFFDDIVTRSLYSTDASIYQELPSAVIRPKHKNDCIKIVKWANKNKIPLIPRTAGTSIAGQCVGSGVVVDFSRYMTKILSPLEGQQVTVQPGVILEHLNQFALSKNLKFSQDISTSNRCMMGGMVANNACGSHSVLYGTTREHIKSLEVILSDGALVKFESLTEKELNKKSQQNDLEGKIYRNILDIITNHSQQIKSNYPDKKIIRRNTGYALDYMLNNQPWNNQGNQFNLAPLICGSEGTLVLITEITLALVPIPEQKLMICAHFQSLPDSMRAIPIILEHDPAAIELIDNKIIRAAKNNTQQLQHTHWIDGKPEAVLAIELFGNNIDTLQKRADQIIAHLKSKKLGYSYPIIPSNKIKDVWAIRKAGLGLLMGMPGDKKAVGIIEDTAVTADDLYHYIQEIILLLKKLKIECVFYGHASVGLLHLRPELNLKDENDKKIFRAIADKVALLVQKYNGSLSGEHGDGRLRAPYLENFYGKDIYHLFKRIKNSFDPDNLFNPGKIISTKDVLDNLRVKNKYFKVEAEKCNGAGVCRKIDQKGVMCPSYQATKEELFSTRGRANLFRQFFQSKCNEQELLEGLKNTLALCLSCKACKTECPANVDISKLKAEFLNLYRIKKGMTLKDFFIKQHQYILKISTLFPNLTNKLLSYHLLKQLLGIDQRRSLPKYSSISLKKWYKQFSSSNNNGLETNSTKNKKICLIVDIFSQYFVPLRVIAVIKLLNHFNYEIEIIYLNNSPRLFISRGLLAEAQKSLENLTNKILPMIKNNFTIIGIEPSEILTLNDELSDLPRLDTDKKQLISDNSFLFDEFFLNEINSGYIDMSQFSNEKRNVYIHTHCHQKALGKHNQTIKLLSKIPNVKLIELPKGCCGMAGSFGYENYELSIEIANRSILPELKKIKNNSIVVTTGVSCHHQIEDLLAIKTQHPAEILINGLDIK